MPKFVKKKNCHIWWSSKFHLGKIIKYGKKIWQKMGKKTTFFNYSLKHTQRNPGFGYQLSITSFSMKLLWFSYFEWHKLHLFSHAWFLWFFGNRKLYNERLFKNNLNSLFHKYMYNNEFDYSHLIWLNNNMSCSFE